MLVWPTSMPVPTRVPADLRRCALLRPNCDADPMAPTHVRRTSVAGAGVPEQERDLHRLASGFRCRHHDGVPLRSRRRRRPAMVAPTLRRALDVARRGAYVILGGALRGIDRVSMGSG